MGRPPRNSLGGYVYHVVCRGLQPKGIFRSANDYDDFETVLVEAVQRFEPRVLSYVVLPKHWHLIVTPRQDGDLSRLIAWITVTHSARWHVKPRRSGTGGLYERRFRSFPVQDDSSLLDVMRFVESHPKRSGLCENANDWKWSSAFSRCKSENKDQTGASVSHVSSPPIALPKEWLQQINADLSEELRTRLVHSIVRGRPYGDASWVTRTAKRMGLESTLRPRGRPKVSSKSEQKNRPM